jgi:hypothetical protein
VLHFLKASPRLVLLGLLKVRIVIKVAAYLLCSALEVDLARRDVDDCSCGVKEWSPKSMG